MGEFSFHYLQKQDFSIYAPVLFEILYTNMIAIAPTGNDYDEDYRFWSNAFGNVFIERTERKIVLIQTENKVIGFFSYSCIDNTFKMEEIQFLSEYKGRYGLFRKLYNFVTSDLPSDLIYVEAYANKNNIKSISILNRLGLKNIGTNKNETSFHFKGTYQDYLSWLNH